MGWSGRAANPGSVLAALHCRKKM